MSGLLHNTAVLFEADGREVGAHRKMAVIPGGSESWSSAGASTTVLELASGIRSGVAICADACLMDLAPALAPKRPDIVLSPAAWSPGLHGPEGEWERLSDELSVPVLVSNRRPLTAGTFARRTACSPAMGAGSGHGQGTARR